MPRESSGMETAIKGSLGPTGAGSTVASKNSLKYSVPKSPELEQMLKSEPSDGLELVGVASMGILVVSDGSDDA